MLLSVIQTPRENMSSKRLARVASQSRTILTGKLRCRNVNMSPGNIVGSPSLNRLERIAISLSLGAQAAGLHEMVKAIIGHSAGQPPALPAEQMFVPSRSYGIP
jgi:hypothetical protein